MGSHEEGSAPKTDAPKKSLRPLRKSELKKGAKGLKKSRLKQVSKKRKEVEGPEYSRLRLQFLKDFPWCSVCLKTKACPQHATDIHHRAGRGKFLLRVDTWTGLCREHHTWVHDNPAESKVNGLLMTREQIRLLEEQEL